MCRTWLRIWPQAATSSTLPLCWKLTLFCRVPLRKPRRLPDASGGLPEATVAALGTGAFADGAFAGGNAAAADTLMARSLGILSPGRLTPELPALPGRRAALFSRVSANGVPVNGLHVEELLPSLAVGLQPMSSSQGCDTMLPKPQCACACCCC